MCVEWLLIIIFKIKFIMAEINKQHSIKLFEVSKDIYENKDSLKGGIADLVKSGIKKTSIRLCI